MSYVGSWKRITDSLASLLPQSGCFSIWTTWKNQAEGAKPLLFIRRDAIEHPGFGSIDGEIARLLIWEHPLSNMGLYQAAKRLPARYVFAKNELHRVGKLKSLRFTKVTSDYFRPDQRGYQFGKAGILTGIPEG